MAHDAAPKRHRAKSDASGAPSTASDALAVHQLLDSVPLLSTYRAKFFAAVIAATLTPSFIGIVIAMLGVDRMSVATLALLLSLLGIAAATIAVWFVDRLLAPLDAAAEALDAHAERREVPRLDIRGTDTAAQLVRGVQALVARLKAQDEAQQQREERDEATGLYGRRTGRARAQQVIDADCKRGRVVRAVAVRIDGFGAFNDAHGYGHGEALLKAVGARVARVAGDHGVALRSGGDEFIIVRGIAPNEPVEYEHALGRSIVMRGAEDPVTLSLGVAQTEQAMPFESLSARASAALVEGRNQRALRAQGGDRDAPSSE